MELIEIVLLVAGGIIFILSFLIPARGEKRAERVPVVAQDEVRSMVGREMEAVRDHVDEVVEEAVSYAMEKTERSLERLSNEKIMAINEYSDTVLSEIHKNHEEAVFLYDMLNSKHTSLKNTMSDVNRAVKEAEEAVHNFQKLVPEQVDSFQRLEPEPVSSFQRLAPELISSLQRLAPEPMSSFQNFAPEPVVEAHPKAAFVRAAEEQMALVYRELEPPIEVDSIQEASVKTNHSDNFNERILQLYAQGMDKVSIAKELGLGVGEVKLVIDLFEGN